MNYLMVGLLLLAAALWGMGIWGERMGESADEKMVSSFYYLGAMLVLGIDVAIFVVGALIKAWLA